MSDAGSRVALSRSLRSTPLPRGSVDALQRARLAGLYYATDAIPATGSLWLTTPELTGMRRTAALSLPSTCTISRKTATSDGQGGNANTWSDLLTYACRLAPRTRREEDAEGRLVAKTEWQLLLPYGATIAATDRVTLAGVTYEVTETEVPRSEAIFTEATVVRVS